MCSFKESPNKAIGRFIYKPEAIVIHRADGSFEGALSWLTNPKSMVSAHFLIKETGEVFKLVDPKDTAWHAGRVINAQWKGLRAGINPNLYTIGIEIAGWAKDKPTIYQIVETARLIKEMASNYKISIDEQHIIPHNWINGSKSCPGTNVNIATLIYLANLI